MPIDLPKRIANNIDRFTGRAWLLPKILEWWDKSDERLFLLIGGLGTGKSMILAWLAGHGPVPAAAEAQRQLSALRAWVKAWHFCVAESGNPDPKVVAQHIADQLTRRVPGFGKALTATLADQVRIDSVLKDVTVQQGGSATGVYIGHLNLQGLSEELSFNRVLRDPLKQLYKDGYDQPMLLLFDALDEALTYSGMTNVVQLLAKLSDLPAQVRILATTRDEPRVLKFFHIVKPFDLIKDATPDIDDVRTYAEVRLAKVSAQDTVKGTEFAQRLAQKAAGVFLYAAIVIDELLERPPCELPDLENYPLPDGLSGLYHQFLIRELGKDDPSWFDLYEPLLGLIAVAQGDGLTAQQLSALIGKDIRVALRASKQYLTGELPDGPFRPFHKSFTDFLVEDPHNGDFHIDPITMHSRIAEYYWSKHHRDWTQCEGYGLDHLAIHLYKGEQVDRLEQLISPDWMRARIVDYRYGGFIADVEQAWRAALLQEGETALTDSIRYALIRSSFNSILNVYPTALAARALETGLWTSERAASVASSLRALPAVHMWATLLATHGLLPADRARGEEMAIAEAQQMPRADDRAFAFATLAGSLGGDTRTDVVRRGLAATREIANFPTRARALIKFISVVPQEKQNDLLLEVLATVRDRDGWQSCWERSFAVRDVAPSLDADLALIALRDVATFTDRDARAAAQAALIPRMPSDCSEMVAQEVLDCVRHRLCSKADGQSVGTERRDLTLTAEARQCLDLLKIVAAFLSPDAKCKVLLQDAPMWLRRFDADASFRWFFEIVPRLSVRMLTETLNNALSLPVGVRRAEAMVVLAPLVSKQDRDALFCETEISLHNAPPNVRLKLLSAWLPYTEGQMRDRLIRQVLGAATEITDALPVRLEAKVIVSVAIREVLSFVPDTLTDAGLRIAVTPGMLPVRDELLSVLAPRLSKAQLAEALGLMGGIKDEFPQVKVASVLAGQLAGKLKQEMLRYAVQAMRALALPYWRVKVLNILAPLLDNAQKERILEQGVHDAQNSDVHTGLAFTYLAGHLNDNLAKKAMDVARNTMFHLPGEREEALAAIGACLAVGDERSRLVNDILDSLEHVEPSARTQVIERLTPVSEGDQLRRCWLFAKSVPDAGDRVKALAEVAARLANDDRDSAFREAEDALAMVDNPRDRVIATAALARRRTDNVMMTLVAHALEVVDTIEEPDQRARAIAELLPHLSVEEQQKVVLKTVDHLTHVEAYREATVLEVLAEHVPSAALNRVSTLATRITDVGLRARVLATVSNRLLRQSAAGSPVFQQIGTWLLSLKEADRSTILNFCATCLSNGSVLTQKGLGSIAGNVREITEEWQFDPAVALHR